MYRFIRPKSGYGGKWDPRRWRGCCTKRDHQKKSSVSENSYWYVSIKALGFCWLLLSFLLCYCWLWPKFMWACILICLCSPSHRPDFADDDEGSKLFRYFLSQLDVFAHRGSGLSGAWCFNKQCFLSSFSGVTMMVAPTMIKSVLPGRRRTYKK